MAPSFWNAFVSHPLVALFTPVLAFVLCVFVLADNLAATLRTRDGALYDFLSFNVLYHFSTSSTIA
ncbi:MAG: hypothetical protein ACXV3T_08170 [Halobacteriota archaeon]